MKKISPQDPESKSEDLVKDNIDQIKALFPEIVSEGKIDFEVLKEVLGEEVIEEEEYYKFTWAGKAQARREANKPSTGTLRPVKDESLHWEETKNLYIEGDNLEVLKLMQKSYAGKVRMIYIDPPYNTGNEFVYKDDYKDNLHNYQALTGQVDDEGRKMTTNTESQGRFHSNWLNMMYPRLRLARNLLSDDGVIFMSIDDHEVENLKKVGNEIFGEDNFKNTIITKRGPKSIQSQFNFWDKLGNAHEYLLFYSKKTNYRFPKQTRKIDVIKKGSWNNHWRGTDRPSMRYEIFNIKPSYGQWRWGKERSEIAIENYKKLLEDLGETEKTVDQEQIDKYYISLKEKKDFLRLSKSKTPEHYIPPNNKKLVNSLWTDMLIGSSSEVLNLFDTKIFDTSKLTSVMKRVLNFANNDSIILDFFSGSASTAHAVMQLNAEDGGERQHIQVQLPEATDEGSEAYKAGYKTLTAIGKERIRRAGKQILSDLDEELRTKQKELDKLKEKGNDLDKIDSLDKAIKDIRARKDKLDTGFKVFRLDASNIKTWSGDPKNLEQNLINQIDNIVADRNHEDVLYEVLLKFGIDLSAPVLTREHGNNKIYAIGYGALFICLDESIPLDVAHGIGEWKKELEPESSKVVFRDTGLNDEIKTNSIQVLKQYGVNQIRSI